MHKSVIVPFTDSPGIVYGLCVLVIYFWNSADLIQLTIPLEMPVPSQGHYGFHSFPVVD
jgi:hypothetical protein